MARKDLINLEYLKGKKSYAFITDNAVVLNAKGDVDFCLKLEVSADPNAVRTTLDALTSEAIGYATYLDSAGLMVCTTNQAAYESLFQARLKQEKTKGKLGYTSHGYQEIQSGKVPQGLSSLVEAYWLNVVSRKA